VSDKEAMIRWQGYARESRTAVNSHFLAYSAGILAVMSSILISKDVPRIILPCIYSVSATLAIISLIIGSIAVLIRLRDARLTACIARYRHEGREQVDIELLRVKTDSLGEWTNTLIPFQVIIFVISAIFFVLWIVLAHKDKFLSVVA
jgi:hypothetical protein